MTSYYFARYFGCLKKQRKQQVYLEGSITEAYLEAERAFFASYYFDPTVPICAIDFEEIRMAMNITVRSQLYLCWKRK